MNNTGWLQKIPKRQPRLCVYQPVCLLSYLACWRKLHFLLLCKDNDLFFTCQILLVFFTNVPMFQCSKVFLIVLYTVFSIYSISNKYPIYYAK